MGATYFAATFRAISLISSSGRGASIAPDFSVDDARERIGVRNAIQSGAINQSCEFQFCDLLRRAGWRGERGGYLLLCFLGAVAYSLIPSPVLRPYCQ